MFKKAGDNVHYLGRAGSHSTKGARTGRIDMPSPEDFLSPSNVAAMVQEIRALTAKEKAFLAVVAEAKPVLMRAISDGDAAMVRDLRRSIGKAKNIIASVGKERKKLKSLLSSDREKREAQKSIDEQNRVDHKRALKVRREARRSLLT